MPDGKTWRGVLGRLRDSGLRLMFLGAGAMGFRDSMGLGFNTLRLDTAFILERFFKTAMAVSFFYPSYPQ